MPPSHFFSCFFFGNCCCRLGDPTPRGFHNADATCYHALPSCPGAHAASAQTLFGELNRWGKLPYTIYPEVYSSQVALNNYDMSKAPGEEFVFAGSRVRVFRYCPGLVLSPVLRRRRVQCLRLLLGSLAAGCQARVPAGRCRGMAIAGGYWRCLFGRHA